MEKVFIEVNDPEEMARLVCHALMKHPNSLIYSMGNSSECSPVLTNKIKIVIFEDDVENKKRNFIKEINYISKT